MSKNKTMKSYDEAFKIGVVKLVLDEGQSIAKVAADLGVSNKTIYNWIAKASKQDDVGSARKEAFPGKGKRGAESERIRQLEKENRLLKMERDLLKKTMGFFVERPE